MTAAPAPTANEAAALLSVAALDNMCCGEHPHRSALCDACPAARTDWPTADGLLRRLGNAVPGFDYDDARRRLEPSGGVSCTTGIYNYVLTVDLYALVEKALAPFV